MPKTTIKNSYVCNQCGSESSSWAGKCLVCGEWNSLVLSIKTSSKIALGNDEVVNLANKINSHEERLTTNIKSVDYVLGGGIVPGSVNLISGEPGMGKSTLLMQIAAGIAANSHVLYASGEESTSQILLRANRLKVDSNQIFLTATNSADVVVEKINSRKYNLVIIDSIQTMTTESIGSSSGSVAQITNCATIITAAAKVNHVAVIIIGHVTKDGNLAGPKLLEHIVDVVLSLEGDQTKGLKLLRVNKNRYGSNSEVAIFEMMSDGLKEVTNPSKTLLAERKITDGSVVLAAIEGSSPLLVEVQALVNSTNYGYPKRAVSGLELGRLNLLIAVLNRRTNVNLTDKDVYVNIVGGIKVNEPAADLAIALAILSAYKGKKIDNNIAVFGEIGLSGELRSVSFIEKRINEAEKLGFNQVIGPRTRKAVSSSCYHPVEDINYVLEHYLN